jgi:hypothetical protein
MRKTEKAARGQVIWTDSGRVTEKPFKGIDESEGLLGRKMGGGPLDLSKSLGGGSPEKDVTYNDQAPKSRKGDYA